MIAEVHHTSFQNAEVLQTPEARSMGEEAAKAPGSEQLLVLANWETGEGLVVHLWRDRDAYDAFATRRAEMSATAEEETGGKIQPTEFLEVIYNSSE